MRRETVPPPPPPLLLLRKGACVSLCVCEYGSVFVGRCLTFDQIGAGGRRRRKREGGKFHSVGPGGNKRTEEEREKERNKGKV